MQKFISVMKALSDPNRVKIVKLLRHRRLCGCEIQEALGIAQSSVSKHLKILDQAGLVSGSRDGLWVDYRPADGTENPYSASMLGNLRHWLDADGEVAEMAARIPENHRRQTTGG
ncbi:ArsR/SmtB family transcription factor [Desulfococcus sp.]|uniref:ArsR/SmtB family transcription factor n=1 Tax=Desulfococcus sp. TaxID=2025834 RepID=UPI0035937905